MALTKVRSAGFTAGAILQVVQTTTSTAVNGSGDDVTATGLSLAITPQSTSNKILVTGSVNGVCTNATSTGVNIDVFRGAASSDTKIADAHDKIEAIKNLI